MFFNEETLDSIKADWKELYSVFKDFSRDAVKSARFDVAVSSARMYDVHFAWVDDIYRVHNREPHLTDGLDHFKIAGHLSFWLRRFTPVVDLIDLSFVDSHEPWAEQDLLFRDFLKSYLNEYLAFEFGMELVRFYETFRIDGAGPRATEIPTESFYRTTVHFMKFKTVSPHAMNLIYKGFFGN